MKYWAGIAVRCWEREVAGGEAPKLGDLSPKETAEKKILAKCKSLNYDGRTTRLELHKHLSHQKEIRRRSYRPLNKALGGPQEHEEFTAWEYDHPIVDLFRVPNNLDCSSDLWGYSVLFYLLTGELHWWVIRNEYRVPVEVWVIPSHWIVRKAVTDGEGRPVSMLVQNPWGQMQAIPYDDVLSFYDLSPLNRYEGWSVNHMVAEWIDAYETMLRSRLAQNVNGGIPAFHVSLSDEYVDPDEAMLNRYYAKWFARFQGPDNAGKPLITGPGVEVKALSISPVDMDYVNTENQFRDMILGAYGVPKGVVGLEPSSDVSAYAPQRQFLRFAVNPFLGKLGQRITHGLIRRTPNCGQGVCFWDDRVIDDPEAIRAEEKHLWETGAIAPDEIRNRHGMEPWPFGGDDPWMNGVELPWATGAKHGDELELDESMGRAERGQMELAPVDSSPEDQPLIVDNDEKAVDEEPAAAPAAKLRWFRTRDGDLSARGESGKWYIERKRRKDGKVGYVMHHTKPAEKDQYEFDADLACGILKELAEKEESKALGESSGAAGGYAVPVEQPPDQVQKALAYHMSEQQKLDHNAQMTDLLKRRGLILGGRSMVMGNGSTNGKH